MGASAELIERNTLQEVAEQFSAVLGVDGIYTKESIYARLKKVTQQLKK